MNFLDIKEDVIEKYVLEEMKEKGIEMRCWDYIFENYIVSPLAVMEKNSDWNHKRTNVILNQIRLAEAEGVDLSDRLYMQHMLMGGTSDWEAIAYGLIDMCHENISFKRYLDICISYGFCLKKDLYEKLCDFYTKEELDEIGVSSLFEDITVL